MEEKSNQKKEKRSKKEVIYTIKMTILFTCCIGLAIILPVFYILVIGDNSAYKPIIYLYPTEKTEINVELGNPQKISHSYPKYENSWKVIAEPNGDLIDTKNGRKLYSLYWEGKNKKTKQINSGFCIKGSDTTKFLEEKLEILGLSEREANEFIIYWLPKMEENKYNLVYFETADEINDYMPLNITPTPESLIRVMMIFKAVDCYVNIPEQHLETLQRTGFVAVEWGGTEVK